MNHEINPDIMGFAAAQHFGECITVEPKTLIFTLSVAKTAGRSHRFNSGKNVIPKESILLQLEMSPLAPFFLTGLLSNLSLLDNCIRFFGRLAVSNQIFFSKLEETIFSEHF